MPAFIIPSLNILNVHNEKTNNSVTVQVGDVISGDVESQSAQYIQQVGLCSLPSNPVPGKSAAECVLIKNPQRDYVIATRDVASQGNYGNLQPGETSVYGAGPDGKAQGRVMIKADGSVSLYTTDSNDASGNGVYLQVSPTGLTFFAPWGKLIFDATGLHIRTQSGAAFDLGCLNAPGPLSSLGSYARITAALTTLDSASVFLGPNGAYLPAANGPLAGMPVAPFASTASTSVFIGT